MPDTSSRSPTRPTSSCSPTGCSRHRWKPPSWDGQLVAPVFWANTQLLWYRKSVASAAGVDPTAADFTWQAMIEAAEAEGKRIGVQGRRYEGYMVWINALVRSGGGQIIENPELGADATPTVASDGREHRRRDRR